MKKQYMTPQMETVEFRSPELLVASFGGAMGAPELPLTAPGQLMDDNGIIMPMELPDEIGSMAL